MFDLFVGLRRYLFRILQNTIPLINIDYVEADQRFSFDDDVWEAAESMRKLENNIEISTN